MTQDNTSEQEVLPPADNAGPVNLETQATPESARSNLAVVEAPGQALAPSGDTIVIMQLLQDAAKRGDTSTLEKLMDLRDRDRRDNAKMAFDADFVAMKPHLPLVVNTHDNTQTKSKYAKLEDINRQIDPVLGAHGFGTSSKILKQDDAGVTVEVILRHRASHTENHHVWMPLDDKGIAGTKNKTGPHAVASSITYARRIGLATLLGISTGDDKDGNLTTDPITEEQAALLDELLKKSNANRKQLFTMLKVEGDEMDTSKILAKDFARAVKMLNDKIAKNAKKAEAK